MLPERPAVLPVLGGAAAVVCAFAAAVYPPAGLALLIGGLYLGLALANLPLALVLWVPLVFLEGLTAFNLGAKATGLILFAAWLPAVLQRGPSRPSWVSTPPRRLCEVLVLLVLWLTLSVLWADSPAAVLADAWHWAAVGLIFVLVATSLPTMGMLRGALVGFIAGAVLSMAAGIGAGGFGSEATASQLAEAPEARLGGALGDPNFLAAGLVPAVVLAWALTAVTRSALARLALVVAVVLLLSGLVASESRGGALALLVTLAAALVVFRGRRAQVSVVALAVLALVAVWFSASPTAWDRVSRFDNGGSGRSDLWTVAWRAADEHPTHGVGLNNFTSVAPRYVREPGTLTQVQLLTERPQVVHNTYLQMLTEAGVIGLGLFVVFVGGCLATAGRAARLFRQRGQPTGEVLAQAVLVATIAMLAAGVFVSAGVDKRLWILLGLGPALLALAQRMPHREH
jgi:O-antigen ligase